MSINPENSVFTGGSGPLRVQYQEQLKGLEDLTIGSLNLVVDLLAKVIKALESQDVELASNVVDGEAPLAEAVQEIHHGVLTILARQAPVAGDLRLIAALMHAIKHIERMGKQCKNIAKLIPLTGNHPPRRDEVLNPILRMGYLAKDEVVQCRQALELRDTKLATDIIRRDQEINDLNREVFRLAIELGDDLDTREWLMTMTMVARAFERVGDNAVDIGEQVIFAVDGDSPQPRV